MQVYLTLPGGKPQGPYSIEEINRNLAAKTYRDTDYWAWYNGQAEWIPLHKVPGVIGSDDTAIWVLEQPAAESVSPSEPLPAHEPAVPAVEAGAASTAEIRAVPETARTDVDETEPSPQLPPQPEGAPAAFERELSSGLPFAALEQIFLLTPGDGPPASRSAVTAQMLEQTVGEPLAAIREQVPRDVVAHCTFIEQLRTEAALPASAWRAMAGFKPDLVQAARAGNFKICVRTFAVESGDLVCLFLFYNKQKL